MAIGRNKRGREKVMGFWNTICLESFCSGEDVDNKYPCGQKYPTVFCLNEGHCPHFMYSESNEREVAKFVPLSLIIWDKVAIILEDIWDKIEWFFWGQLWFNRRKVDDLFKNIKAATRENDSAVAEFEEAEKRIAGEFPIWFEKVKKLENENK